MTPSSLSAARVSCTLAAAAVAAAMLLTPAAAQGKAAQGKAVPLKVTSTLDGLPFLPLRSRWIARPSVSAASISSVTFTIDGTLRWTEKAAPYVYAGDAGFLITTWLAPGRHIFTATVTTKDGRRTSDSVVTRVGRAPNPPAALTGVWARRQTRADQRRAGETQSLLAAGKTRLYRIAFDRVGAWVLNPAGGGAVEQIGVVGNTINVFAPVEMNPTGAGVAAYGARGIGGAVCGDGGPAVRSFPPGSFRWAVRGNTLTLSHVRAGCSTRQAIWDGTWTRVQ